MRTRGYALLVVMAIGTMLSISVATMLIYLGAAQRTTGRLRQSIEASYVCDGMGRVLTRTMSDFLGQTPSAVTTAQLKTAVEARLGTSLSNAVPLRYGTDFFEVTTVTDEAESTIGSGRFAGMPSRRRVFGYQLRLTRLASSTRCEAAMSIEQHRLPFSELALFAADSIDWCPSWSASLTTAGARVHINGDLRVGGSLTLPQTTVTGSLTSSTCGASDASASASPVQFCMGTDCTNVVPAPASTSGGASASGSPVSGSGPGALGLGSGSGGGSPTPIDASGLLAGAVPFADSRRSVPRLQLPLPVVPVQQSSVLSGTATRVANADNLRYVIDPPSPGEVPEVGRIRLAMQADIRIIDGVWYKNDGTFPGLAIWSDHAGTFDTAALLATEENLLVSGTLASARKGQGNLAALSACSSLPSLYSVYDQGDAASTSAPTSQTGVVSYGLLKRVVDATATTPAQWAPAYYVNAHVDQDANSDGGFFAAAEASTTIPVLMDRVLLGTRSGFRDAHAAAFRDRNADTMPDERFGNVLPINFDVAAFFSAMDALSANGCELGDRFAGDPHKRQMLVWIAPTWTSVWEGLLTGTGGARPGLPPNAGRLVGGHSRSWESSGKLPYPLCRASSSPATVAGRSVLPPNACGDANVSRPNAVRIINAGANFGTRKLTIATPVAAYVLGDVDRGTDGPGLFVAADSVTFLSNEWNDSDAAWNHEEANFPSRSTAPVWNVTLMTGNLVAPAPGGDGVFPGGIERVPRFLEKFANGAPPTLTGSLIIGFHPVHTTWPTCYNGSNCADDEPWNWDRSATLNTPTSSPPGMPNFVLRAVGETVPDRVRRILRLPPPPPPLSSPIVGGCRTCSVGGTVDTAIQ